MQLLCSRLMRQLAIGQAMRFTSPITRCSGRRFVNLLRCKQGLFTELSWSPRALTTRTPTRPSLPLPHSSTFTPITQGVFDTNTSTQTLDLLPKISAHPALAGIQVRNGPRDTYDPSHRVRKRRHGFLARLRSRTGRKILKRRKAKGRSTLSH